MNSHKNLQEIRAHVPTAEVGPKLTKPEPPASSSPSVIMPLSALTLDPDFQSRAELNHATVEQYRVRIEQRDIFPPLVAFEFDGKQKLVSGFHTYAALLQAGISEFLVQVRQGSRADAIACSIAANLTHGRPLTNADKRRCVQLELQQHPDLSDHAIAERVKVSQPFVGSVRRQLKTVVSSGQRIGRDGKRRRLPEKRPAVVSPEPSSTPHSVERIRKSVLPYVAGVSVSTMLISATHFLQEMEDDLHHEDWLRTLNRLIDEVARATYIPRPVAEIRDETATSVTTRMSPSEPGNTERQPNR